MKKERISVHIPTKGGGPLIGRVRVGGILYPRHETWVPQWLRDGWRPARGLVTPTADTRQARRYAERRNEKIRRQRGGE